MSDDKRGSRFLDKWLLVRAAARDGARLSLGDVSVLIALCDRYGSKYDPDAPALAGHALLASMTGLSRRATIDSTRRLIDAGYIYVAEPAVGTRGTKYGLVFASSEPQTTTSKQISSGEPEFTTVVNHAAPLERRSGEADFTTLPPTCIRRQDGLHVVVGSSASPAAPLADGLGATAAGHAEGFDSFWSIWPKKVGIKKARAEWGNVESCHDAIIEAACKWADHYKAAGTDKKWIPDPANWLRDDRYLEDLPAIRTSAMARKSEKPEGLLRRDISVKGITRAINGWRVDVDFNDAGEEDAPTATFTYSDAELSALMCCVGLDPEAEEVEAAEGARVILAIDEDDGHHFEHYRAAA